MLEQKVNFCDHYAKVEAKKLLSILEKCAQTKTTNLKKKNCEFGLGSCFRYYIF